MAKNAEPSRNPADDSTIAGAFRLILDKFLQKTDDMLPAQVISYDRTTGFAEVQPLIMMVSTAGEQVSRAPVASVPVLQIGGGGFILSFPIIAGDLGWIKANDRDISNFTANFSEVRPNTARKHSFSDAMFIPHVMKDFSISSDDAAAVVLQSTDGSVLIALSADRLKLTAPTVEIVSTSVMHNGVNIGATHRHSGVQAGPDDTGVPV